MSQKGDLKDVQNSRWQGKVFNVVLQDESGDIRATGFEDMAKKFHSIFQEGKVYFVSHAKVRSILNKQFNPTTHDYELNLNQVIKESKFKLLKKVNK